MSVTPNRSKNSLFPFLLFSVFFFLVLPFVFARQPAASAEPGEETSASEAQVTMASLFGRGGKMPGIPRIDGTIALPAFDNSEMKIDEGSLNEAQRGERNS